MKEHEEVIEKYKAELKDATNLIKAKHELIVNYMQSEQAYKERIKELEFMIDTKNEMLDDMASRIRELEQTIQNMSVCRWVKQSYQSSAGFDIYRIDCYDMLIIDDDVDDDGNKLMKCGECGKTIVREGEHKVIVQLNGVDKEAVFKMFPDREELWVAIIDGKEYSVKGFTYDQVYWASYDKCARLCFTDKDLITEK